jgi:hypothetical protein
MRALVLTVLLSGCSMMAPRIGVCPSPLDPRVSWRAPIECHMTLGSDEDVTCIYEGWSLDRKALCRWRCMTLGCGSWTCGEVCDGDPLPDRTEI